MPEAAVDWNDANTKKLTTMWAAGYSASEIAAVISHASRSGVLGKIMRLKLPPRDKGHGSPGTGPRIRCAPQAPRPGKIASIANAEPPQRRNPTNSLAAKIAIAETEPGLPPRLKGEAPDGTGVKLIDLEIGRCKWPRGDPLDENFEFCGGKAIHDMPYCAGHSRLAYAPPPQRRPVSPAH